MRPPQAAKTPQRVWLYGRGGWTHGPIVVRSGDAPCTVVVAEPPTPPSPRLPPDSILRASIERWTGMGWLR